METRPYQQMDTGGVRRWCGCTFKPVEEGLEEDQWKKVIELYMLGAFFFEAGALSHTFMYIESKANGEHMTYLAYCTKSVAIPFFIWAMAGAQKIDREKARDFTKEVMLDIFSVLCIETIVTVAREITEGARGYMIAAEVIDTLIVTYLFYKTYKTYIPNNRIWLFM